MRKNVLLILLTVLSLSVLAQNVGEAFYIYRNDGDFNVFFRDEIDSIVYSNYDMDSLYHENYVTQVVYTQDTICRIPLAAIDSVGFVTPETIYQPDAKELSDKTINYIIDSDTLSILFKSDTPSELLPKIGDKIVTTKISRKFPSGFMGRVQSIGETDNGIRLICEPIGIEEIFIQYYYVVRGDKKTGNGHGCCTPDLSTYSSKFNTTTLTDKLSKYITLTDDYAFTCGLNYSFTAKPSFSAKGGIVVNPLLGVLVSFDVNASISSSVRWGLSGRVKYWDNIFEEDKWPTIPVPLEIPFLYMYVSIGPFLKADLQGSMENNYNYNLDYTIHYRHIQNPVLPIPLGFVGVEKKKHDYSGKGKYMLEGKLYGGVFVETGIAFVSKKLAKAACRTEAGIEIGGDLLLTQNDKSQSLLSPAVYNRIKSNSLYTKFVADIGGQAKILKFLETPKINVFHFEKEFYRRKAVPGFYDTLLEYDEDDPFLLHASSSATGQSLSVDLGLRLKVLENAKEKWMSSILNRNYIEGSHHFETKIKINDPIATLELYPTVSLFGIEMLAEPHYFLERKLCPDDNHPHMIDLGLPSGTLWSCCNVGASAPEEFGNYYAWGETSPKDDYSYNTYKYYEWDDRNKNGIMDSGERKNKDIGGNIAGTSYDQAHINGMGRIPDQNDYWELLNNSKGNSRFGSYNYKDVRGLMLTGPNGNSIFLPCAGWYEGTSLKGLNMTGRHWANHEEGNYPGSFSFYLGGGAPFYSEDFGHTYYIGASVRGVSK